MACLANQNASLSLVEKTVVIYYSRLAVTHALHRQAFEGEIPHWLSAA